MQRADKKFIHKILSNNDVFKWISEDGTKLQDVYTHSSALCFKYEDYGFIEFRPITTYTWEAHICMLPRSPNVARFSTECIMYAASRGIKVIYATIPEFNKHAKMYVKKLGFVNTGIIPKSFQKYGKMHDINIWSLEIDL